MYQYATSVPDKIALETEWLEGLKRAKLKRIEYSCSGACTAENIGEKVRIMAELQDAGGVIIGSIHIPFGKTWEFADPDESKRKPASDKTAAFIRACAPLKCKNFTMHGCLEPVPWDNPERAEWIKAFRKNTKSSELWALPVADDSTADAASGSLTFAVAGSETTPKLSIGGTVRLMISGQSCPVNVSAGDSAADVATKAAAAINAKSNLPVSASALSAVVTLTAKNLGAYGNGIDVRWNHNQGEVLPDGLSVTLSAMANGGADPLFEDADVKATCAGNWFNMIVIGSADTDNINYIKEMLDERWTAIVQQTGVMCFSLNGGSEADFTDKANALNSQEIVLAALPKSPTSGAEKASALFGCVAPKALNDPAAPLHNYAVAGVVAPRRDDREDFDGNNRLLKSGCALMTAADDGSVFTSRIVTTYKRNAQGVQDKSYMQLETVLTLSYLRWDWNNFLALKYPHAKLAPDGSKIGEGQQVMTPSLGKSELVGRYKYWEEKGLVYDSEGFAEAVIVQLDPDDEYAMNFLIPAHLIKQFFVSKSKMLFD